MDTDDALELVIQRAHAAIARAKVLSGSLSRAGDSNHLSEHLETPPGLVASSNSGHSETAETFDGLISSLGLHDVGSLGDSSSHEGGGGSEEIGGDQLRTAEETLEAAARLRVFLHAQISSSQAILAQLQDQQRRADDLSLRLSTLRTSSLDHHPPFSEHNQDEILASSSIDAGGCDDAAPNTFLQQTHQHHQKPQSPESEMELHPTAASGSVHSSCTYSHSNGSIDRRWDIGGDNQSMVAPTPISDHIDRSPLNTSVADPMDLDIDSNHDCTASSTVSYSEIHRVPSEPNVQSYHLHGPDLSPDQAEVVSQASLPIQIVATRLALLQQQQSNTMTHLMMLRMDQLRLRQQQLSALQELLRAELDAVIGTELQVSSVHQAMVLLGSSLEETQLAVETIREAATAELSEPHGGGDRIPGAGPRGSGGGIRAGLGSGLAAVVMTADRRAENVSRMARHLLSVLREFPRREDNSTLPPAGASEAELEALPLAICCDRDGPVSVRSSDPQLETDTLTTLTTMREQGSRPASTAMMTVNLAGESCGICLAEFELGETLRSADGTHFFHPDCIFSWLRIRAACPTCRVSLASRQ